MSEQVAKPSRHHIWRITLRTLSKSWDDSIFSESAQAGFWSALSLPPLLLGMLGTLAYVAPLFGPDMLPSILRQLIPSIMAIATGSTHLHAPPLQSHAAAPHRQSQRPRLSPLGNLAN